MINPGCRWVRPRLALVAGDDLRGADRRRVERHLIGCPDCRRRLDTTGLALQALRAAGSEPAARADAPSLWPALATQIRESRRPSAAPSFGLDLGLGVAWPRLRFWPALGLGLTLLAALGATVAARRQADASRAEMAAHGRPIAAPGAGPLGPAPASAELAATPAPAPASAPAAEGPAPAETPVVENSPPPTRLDYDLDHGTPMGPDSSRDAKPAAY